LKQRKQAPKTRNKIWLGCFLIGLLLSISVSAFAAAGSKDDPLVTKSWLDSYLNQKFSAVQTQLDAAKASLNEVRGLLGSPHIVLYIGKTQALVNNQTVTLDAAPQIVGGYTMLPMRFVGESLNITVAWDNTSKTISCKSVNQNVILPLYGGKANIDGKVVTLSAPPRLVNGRVMVPARFIAEAFGCRVDWTAAEKKVDIY